VAYEYGAKEPEKLKIKDMTPKEEELLIKSDTFCMLPWQHIHAFPDGRAYPCCFSLDKYPVGRSKQGFHGNSVQRHRHEADASEHAGTTNQVNSVPNVMTKRSQDSSHCV
jgi:hypothetical protein